MIDVSKCREQFRPSGKVSVARYMVITDNAFLLLEPKQGNTEQMLLVAWSFLYSLVRVRVAGSSALVLSWRALADSDSAWEQSLEILEEDPHVLATMLVRRLELLGAKVTGKKGKSVPISTKGRLNEDDVTVKSVASLDINEINEDIALYESAITSGEISVSAVQTLALLYQKAIEYYSALGNPVHVTYVRKLQELMQSREVQSILSSPAKSEPKKQEEIEVGISYPPGYRAGRQPAEEESKSSLMIVDVPPRAKSQESGTKSVPHKDAEGTQPKKSEEGKKELPPEEKKQPVAEEEKPPVQKEEAAKPHEEKKVAATVPKTEANPAVAKKVAEPDLKPIQPEKEEKKSQKPQQEEKKQVAAEAIPAQKEEKRPAEQLKEKKQAAAEPKPEQKTAAEEQKPEEKKQVAAETVPAEKEEKPAAEQSEGKKQPEPKPAVEESKLEKKQVAAEAKPEQKVAVEEPKPEEKKQSAPEQKAAAEEPKLGEKKQVAAETVTAKKEEPEKKAESANDTIKDK